MGTVTHLLSVTIATQYHMHSVFCSKSWLLSDRLKETNLVMAIIRGNAMMLSICHVALKGECEKRCLLISVMHICHGSFQPQEETLIRCCPRKFCSGVWWDVDLWSLLLLLSHNCRHHRYNDIVMSGSTNMVLSLSLGIGSVGMRPYRALRKHVHCTYGGTHHCHGDRLFS